MHIPLFTLCCCVNTTATLNYFGTFKYKHPQKKTCLKTASDRNSPKTKKIPAFSSGDLTKTEH